MAFRTEKLTVQGALPHVKCFLSRDQRRNIVDRSLYMTSISYKFINRDFTIEPKLMYRGVENYKDIIDLGAQFQCWDDQFFMNAMYHSTHSVTLGVGTWYQKQLRILCLYSTGTSDLRKYSNGEFEIALQYQLRY